MKGTPLLGHLEKLPYFVIIVESGTLLSASLRLKVSQPALSKAMNQLEEALGQRLLIRGRTGVQPTPAGQELLACAREVLKDVALYHAAVQSKQKTRTLRLVTHEVLLNSFAGTFAKLDAPKLKLEIFTAPSVRKLLGKIESAEADFGVVAEGSANEQIFSKPLVSDHYEFMCTKSFYDQRLSGTATKSFTLNQISQFPIIMAQYVLAGRGEVLHEHLRRRGITLEPQHVVESIESIAALVNVGLGIGMLPLALGRSLLGADAKVLSVHIPGGRIGEHQINFFCRVKEWYNDPLYTSIFQKLKSAFNKPKILT